LLAWKRGDLAGAAQRLAAAVVLAAIAMAASYAVAGRGPWLAPFAIAIGVFVMAGAISEVLLRARLGSADGREVARRLRNLPRSAYGTALAHFGIGLMVVGTTTTTAYRTERILVMKPGESTEIAGYTLTYRGSAPRRGPNFREQVGALDVFRNGDALTSLSPSKRVYDMPPQPTSEAGIHVSWRGDLYAVLGDEQAGGGHSIRLYFNPLVRFIWLGTLIMFVGGAVSLSDRRLRVGAPIRARSRVAAAPAE
jgi:cytochrome c-type biogenesis protein CcmF